MILEGLGLDKTDAHFEGTPARCAKAWAKELCVGLDEENFNLTTFPRDQKDKPSMIILQHIPVKSVCAHHLLPFFGEAAVAYIPDANLCGLSKLSRVVNYFSRKPQVQEHLTSEIAQYLMDVLKPTGVGVIIKANHTCMQMRGVNHSGIMTTSNLQGSFMKDATVRAEFMSLSNHFNVNLV